MIADMLRNQKLNPMVTELLIRGRKLNIDHAFITQSYFAVAKIISLNSTKLFRYKDSKQKKRFSKLHLIIHEILTFKTIYIYIKIYFKTIFFLDY